MNAWFTRSTKLDEVRKIISKAIEMYQNSLIGFMSVTTIMSIV